MSPIGPTKARASEVSRRLFPRASCGISFHPSRSPLTWYFGREIRLYAPEIHLQRLTWLANNPVGPNEGIPVPSDLRGDLKRRLHAAFILKAIR